MYSLKYFFEYLSVVIVLLGIPKFTEIPVNLTANAGGSATFTCVTFAIPAPVTTWHRITNTRVSEDIPGSHDNIHIDGNMLVIENVDYYRDGGIYTCNATNYVGNMEANVFLEVHGKKVYIMFLTNIAFVISLVPLELYASPSNVTAIEGSAVMFTSLINGTDIYNVTWFSPSGLLDHQSSYITVNHNFSSTGVVSTLYVANIEWPNDEGWYTCQIFADSIDFVRTVEGTAYLHIQGILSCLKQTAILLKYM